MDVGGSRTGRSPSVSPDRGSVPTSPYSVPQIAPMPSSKLCPVCKTTDLMGPGDNFNTCTQCHCKVCNQCGFNPNPHLTEVRSLLERTVPFLLLGSFFFMPDQPRKYQKLIHNHSQYQPLCIQMERTTKDMTRKYFCAISCTGNFRMSYDISY